MSDLTALAERVEAARGPSRELDARLWWETYGKHKPADDRKIWEKDPALAASRYWGGWEKRDEIPHFTASLDAAMTLVPEGWSVGMGDLRGYTPPLWRAHLRDHNPESLTKEGHSHIWKEGHSKCSLALALVAAALRAKGSHNHD